MTPNEKITLLENKLDDTILVIKQLLYHIHSMDNDTFDYFAEKLDKIYNIDVQQR
jgi:hypothetical protein